MNLVEQLRRDEGCVPYAYKDSLGYWTIGVGFLIDQRKGGGLDDAEIDWILQHRISKLTVALQKAWHYCSALDDVRRGAIQNMAYQMGVAGVMDFHNMLLALEVGDWQKAHDEALDSTWATQTPERANRIADQLLTGEWQ